MTLVFQFRAGLLNYSTQDKRLYPEKTSGIVRIEDLINIQGQVERCLFWYERDTSTTDPLAAKMSTKKTLFKFTDGKQLEVSLNQIGSQRTYELNIKQKLQNDALEQPTRIYFWMQDPDTSKDQSIKNFFNQEFLNKQRQNDTTSTVQAPVPFLSPQLPQSSGSSQQPGQLISSNALANILSNLTKSTRGPPLHKILTTQVMSKAVESSMDDFEKELQQYLPPAHQQRAGNEIVAVVSSPAFLQQLETFSIALKTQQLDLTQFGLHPKSYSTADVLQSILDLTNKEQEDVDMGQNDDQT
eukprot:TRINITY_DN2148_c0_g1_i3.p1 TRINITY_DN2148_c0_g1~~TRINITY_DN2148_c0_g1_i3.p1  ORF type:complete len:299 (+),score=17.33 TRINITY_DN2148_c0_g1_i3:187-1083(+)